jgi:hypothetical protein
LLEASTGQGFGWQDHDALSTDRQPGLPLVRQPAPVTADAFRSQMATPLGVYCA